MTLDPTRARRAIQPAAAVWLVLAATAWSQPPWAGGPGGHGPDPAAAADRELFHYLLEHRATITRSVEEIEGGVETVTESGEPTGAAKIVEHVRAMKARMEVGRPIHRRDPLFAALFAHAEQITIAVEPTARGARVREVSPNPHATKLIRAHADVVSRFLAHGWPEVRRDHPVPPR